MRKEGDTSSDPVAIRKACDAYARKYIDIQRAQFKRLGVLGDWENPYLTLNKEYEADELRLFADMVEKGFVYRGKKPVYWSIPCRTALAEAEVEYHDHVSQSIYVKFPVVGAPNTFILIWTTTPWTLPANLAVAYNSTLPYVQVTVNGENYILLRSLLETVGEKSGWASVTEKPFDAAGFAKLEYQHPFCNRTGKLFAGDSFVTSDTGTGFVHIAPGHGLDDYNLGRQQNLPIYSPVDDDGHLAYTNDLPREQQMPAEMAGKSILEKHGKSDANEVVLHELRLRKALLHQENYHHSYPYCWRSKTAVIFRAMDQWFINVNHKRPEFEEVLAKMAAKEYDLPPSPGNLRWRAVAAISKEVEWVPDWGENRIEGAVASRPDWCISRQRTWGVPIPAFYDAQGNAILDAQIVRNTANLIEKHGSNIWFEKSAGELWSLVKPKDWTGASPAVKSNDTLDVWIDSGSSSRAVLMRRPELLHSEIRNPHSTLDWQADVYLEGSDQHRGWFQSSLLLSLAGNNAPPFKTVLTHGFMVDADREKISKSKQAQGGYEKPQTAGAYIKKYGADVLRLWVASQDSRNDIVVSEERINKVSETYRGIRNTLRYQLSNLFDFDPAKHSVPDDKLTGLDRWILAEFSKLESEVIAAYDAYEFHVVYQKVSQFVAVELSAVYHDVVKDRLYTDAANSHRRRSTQTALHRLVTGLCKMLAPILVFTTDETWEFVPGEKDSVHETQWIVNQFNLPESEITAWKQIFALRNSALPQLEKARQNKQIGKSLEAAIELHVPASLAEANKRIADQEAIILCETPTGHGYAPEYIQLKSSFLNEEWLNQIQELFGVSRFAFYPEPETNRLWIVVKKADGQKCERCWHWETDVGSDPQHPTICARCVAAVKENLAGH